MQPRRPNEHNGGNHTESPFGSRITGLCKIYKERGLLPGEVRQKPL